jgi:hypothetical protein
VANPCRESIGIARWSALSLLASHDIALNRPQVVAHFVSDRRLRRDESHPSGIRFVPGNLIRFHSRFYSSKVMAKWQNSRVLSCGYTCYENGESSCRGIQIPVGESVCSRGIEGFDRRKHAIPSDFAPQFQAIETRGDVHSREVLKV